MDTHIPGDAIPAGVYSAAQFSHVYFVSSSS